MFEIKSEKMAEERVKLKDENNNILSTSKEIAISYQSGQNNIRSSENIDINNPELLLTYGKYKIFSYDSKGDPLFLIGPDYTYFIAIIIMNLIYFFFLSILLMYITKYYIAIFGVLLNIIQFGSLIICGLKNPGLPKKEIQNELLLTNDPNRYRRCNLCYFIVDNSKHYVHCNICKCCCEGYDHHCPWTSKCVGRGNIFYFHGMLVMVCIVFVYIIFALIIMGPNK